MKVGLTQCVNKGMQRDASIDKASQEFAYENKNIRITTTGDNSFLSVTNEKSTIKIPVKLELDDSNVIYYDLVIQRSGTMFDGIGNITSAKMVLTKALTKDIHFILNIKSSMTDMAGYNVTARGFSGQSEIDLMNYIPNEYVSSVLALRIWKADNSADYPVWIDHEVAPTRTDLGTVLGSTTIDNKIVLFTKLSEDEDAIIVGEIQDGVLDCKCLFVGDLNFSVDNPIECIASYEADDVQKVYWVDGINQPRVVNICKTYNYSTAFDFAPSIPEGISVNIEKEYNGSGNFPTGVIQYFITFYNKFESETCAAYESPLYYISPRDRGGNVNELQTCNFKITIDCASKGFEYARVYSLIRTSLNSTPQAYIVEDVKLRDNGTTVVSDTNMLNTPIAPTDIMFLGGNTIIASTIEQKDNTLFLGNISEVTTDITSAIKQIENKGTLSFGSKFVPTKLSTNEYYKYSPNLDLSSRDIKTFKYLEWYKIGIQFQLQSGEWSSTVELGDVQNDVRPNSISENNSYSDVDSSDEGIWLPALKFIPSSDLLNILKENPSIKNWRLVMAEHSPETRTIKSQGLVIPTIFNLQERADDTCYSSPLWTLNTALYGEHLGSIDLDAGGSNTDGSAQYSFEMYPFFHMPTAFYREKEGKYFKLNSAIKDTSKEEYSSTEAYLVSVQPIVIVDRYTKYIPPWGFDIVDDFICKIKVGIKNINSDTVSYSEVQIYKYTAPAMNRRSSLKKLSSEVKKIVWLDIWDTSLGSIKVSDLRNVNKNETIFKDGEIPSGDSLRDDYGVSSTNDKTITLSSYLRDVVYTKDIEALKNYGNQYFLDANICNFLSPNIESINKGAKFRIVGFTNIINSISDYSIDVEDSTLGTTTYRYPTYNVNTLSMRVFAKDKFLSGMVSFPLWPYLNKLYYINYWHNGGNILSDKFTLKNKKFANMWYCDNTTYTYPIEYGSINESANVDNETVLLDSKIYKSKYQNVLFPKSNVISYIGGGSESDYPYKQPVNETTPLDKVVEAIQDTDSTEPLTEEVTNVGAVDIKHNSSKHTVFKLPAKEGFFGILPNYTPTKEGDSFVYSNAVYPTGVENVDYIFYISNPSRATILDNDFNGNIYFSLYNNSLQIASIGGNHSILIEADYSNTPEINVISVEDKFSMQQPTFQNIYTERQEKGGFDLEYTGKKWLIKIAGRDDYLLVKLVGGYLKSDNSILYDSATATIVKDSASLSVTNVNSNKEYLITSYKPESDGVMTFYINRKTMFQIPEIQDSRYTELNPKLFIGEFYIDYNKDTFFGGDSQNCRFIPISETYPVTATEGWGLEGDTYYQRHDNVRIYESNSEDTNQNIDAVSFMLEAYENLDGDYRTQRGRLDTTNLTVENTNNAINPVYSQINNYTSSYILDEKFEDSTHPTLYAWSLSKQNLADIDTWTSINLSSSLKLDGDKGVLTKIKRWNNQLLAFQEKGLAVINFNQQTTISTSDGVPVEIANSGKVTGHYYISSTQGCKNKWSISDSPYGLYFIDSYNKSINVFNSEGIRSLSTINLFQDWVVENEKGFIWNPTNNGGFKSFYDPIHKEMYFINDETALCYNELLGQFTSFYDYDKLNSMLPVNGYMYGIREGEFHKLFEGPDYCNLFGNNVNYSMTYKVSKDTFIDKTWTNIEYRADVYDRGNISDINSVISSKDTFNTLEVWNEYQKGTANLLGNKYPNAKVKFRVWRADIPRDFKFKRDRIRNPWIMLKLEKTSNTNKRMEFHDLIVKYLQ